MIRSYLTMVAVGLFVFFSYCDHGYSGKFNKVVDIGDQAPAWKNLIGVDNEQHSLKDHKDAKAVVVIFTCNHCPVAKAYEERFKGFVKEYQDKGVDVVAINVSNIEADRLDKMKIRAKEQEFNFEYLYDPSQEIARKYGATCTPHSFVLNEQRQIAYMGKFDDNMEIEKVKYHYLRDAVDSLLGGEKPEVEETLQVGCSISYEEQG